MYKSNSNILIQSTYMVVEVLFQFIRYITNCLYLLSSFGTAETHCPDPQDQGEPWKLDLSPNYYVMSKYGTPTWEIPMVRGSTCKLAFSHGQVYLLSILNNCSLFNSVNKFIGVVDDSAKTETTELEGIGTLHSLFAVY